MERILLNASNLHVGGGVQVAASAITEIVDGAQSSLPFTIVASGEVIRNLSPQVLEKAQALNLLQLDVHGLALFQARFRALVSQSDKVFTVFGPLYRWRNRGQSIVGFAQPWIIFPDNEVYDLLPWFEKLKLRTKFYIQKQFYKRADLLVVELEHVKEALIRELGLRPDHVRVVRNCVSSIYASQTDWQPLAIPDAGDVLRLGFLGRNYLHKNTAIFPEIVDQLLADHNIHAKFYVTFTEEEWEACSPKFRGACINVGPISVGQCPNFYRNLDAVVFPSLLECFSATPLEAMVMGVPLFASDRPFNRDVCQSHAQYFDPHSTEEVTRLIAAMFSNGGPDKMAIEAAREHAISFSSPVERAEQYLALLGVTAPGLAKQ